MKVFIVSSSDHPKDLTEYTLHPLAVDFLKKPLTEQIIIDRVYQHFEI